MVRKPPMPPLSATNRARKMIDTALASSSSTPPLSGASSSYALVPPAVTRVSSVGTEGQIDQLKNRMMILYNSIYEDDEDFIENVDRLINVLFSMKKLKLQELGLDSTESAVLANTVAATIPQHILDSVPEAMLANIPKKFTRPASEKLGTDPAVPADGQKNKFKEIAMVSNALAEIDLQEAKPASIPEKFKCPISNELMTDPVILASGQTCDRPHMEYYLSKGIWICPITDEVLENNHLIPNLFARDVISEWCKENGVEFPETKKDDEETTLKEDEYSLTVQLERMTKSLTEKVEAAKVIRKITKERKCVYKYFQSFPESIPRFLKPLEDGNAIGIFHHLQEDLIASVYHIIAQDNHINVAFANSPKVIPLILESMTTGTILTKHYAAAALLLFSRIFCNKPLVGKTGALKPLVKLVKEGHPSAMHVASEAIRSLCIVDENVVRAIKAGVVSTILKKIKAHIFLDSFIETLMKLSGNQTALAQMHAGKAESLLKNIEYEEVSAKTKARCSNLLQTIRNYVSNIRQANRMEEKTAGPSGEPRKSRRNTGIPQLPNSPA